MTPVLALPTRTSSRRWPLEAFAAAVGIAGDADLAHAVRVPLVVVVRARRRGLDLGQAEAWCRKIRIAPTAVWPDFTADDPSDAAADDSDGDVEPGVRYCLDPVSPRSPARSAYPATASTTGSTAVWPLQRPTWSPAAAVCTRASSGPSGGGAA